MNRYHELIRILKKSNVDKIEGITKKDITYIKECINIYDNKNSKIHKKFEEHEVCGIVDAFYMHAVYIKFSFDVLETMADDFQLRSNLNSVIQKEHFSYITRKALANHLISLVSSLLKIGMSDNEVTIYFLCNLCKEHASLFNHNFDINKYTDSVILKIQQHENIIHNIIVRRDKTASHNELKYYFNNERAVDEAPVELNNIQVIVDIIFGFAETIKNAFENTWLNW